MITTLIGRFACTHGAYSDSGGFGRSRVVVKVASAGQGPSWCRANHFATPSHGQRLCRTCADFVPTKPELLRVNLWRQTDTLRAVQTMTRASQANTEATLSGWGNVPVPGHERLTERIDRASEGAVLSRGLGRSYGDSSLPPPDRREVLGTRLADRILGFDPQSGVMRAEAGLSLVEINRLMLRRGWFPPVTPGTQYVTLGGMVAADVHGKGHHSAGCFGSGHVRNLKLRLADGRIVECSREVEADLFRATVGGMGLTGHILEVEFAMRSIPSPWIWSESRRCGDIDEFIETIEEVHSTWPYGVGWIDCLSRGRNMGRGILDYGRWATAEEAAGKPLPNRPGIPIPFMMPGWLLGPLSVRAFNTLYYHRHVARHRRHGLRHPASFFYPLDTFLNWNRLYGRRGFTQYQCVLPKSAGRGAARTFLELLTSKGGASFLCVIKDTGPEGLGLLSFPKRGISIALDIAVRDDTQQLVDTLNELVISLGGRIYLAKDGFTRPEHYRAMEPRLDEFLQIRRRFDPEFRLRSAQSVRVLGDPARLVGEDETA